MSGLGKLDWSEVIWVCDKCRLTATIDGATVNCGCSAPDGGPYRLRRANGESLFPVTDDQEPAR